MKVWKDTTIWSHCDIDRSNPREWTLEIKKDFKIIIHRRLGHDDQVWYLTCHKLNISSHKIIGTENQSLDEIKNRAFDMIKLHVDKLATALKALE